MTLVARVVEVDSELLTEAEVDGRADQLSTLLDWALRMRRLGRAPSLLDAEEFKDGGSSPSERARRWRAENVEAIAYHDARIAREGVFGEEWRDW